MLLRSRELIPLPKSEFINGKVVVSYDKNNPKDMKRLQRQEKSYLTMSKPDLVKLVELLISDTEH